MRKFWGRMALATICLGMAIPASAEIIADSQADWSLDGIQGENGWFNGWYNYTADDDQTFAPDDFEPFINDGSAFVDFDGENHWTGNSWALYRDTDPQTGPWTSINQAGGHPNGENSLAPPSVLNSVPEEHWSVRRWVSDYSGEASLTSTLAATNTGCGNGTSVHLFQNGTLLDTLTTATANGVTNTIGATLSAGDIIDFALTPVGADAARGDSCDGSNFALVISDDPPPPPPVPPYADSAADWSITGTQGERNWFNGYFDLSLDDDGQYAMDEFVPFTNEEGEAGGPVDPFGNHWDGTKWDLIAGGAPWTEIGVNATHPNGDNNGGEQWSIRRYVANDLAGTTPMEVTWNMAKTNLNGDGVTGILFVNGQAVDQRTIAGNDGSGVSRTFYLNAEPGDVIDLALTPVGVTNTGDGSDGSVNQLTLRTELPDGDLYNPSDVIYADSFAEFSGTQGQDNWFYGFYDQRADVEDGDGVYAAEDFVPYLNDGSELIEQDAFFWEDSENHWSGSAWDIVDNGVAGTGPWTATTAPGGHPAANGQGTPEVHWAMRRWVSEVDGEVRVDGILNNISASGDGTVGRIFLDGEEVWSSASNGNAVPVDLILNVSEGSILDFAIDPDGAGNFNPDDPFSLDLIADGSDGTTFSFVIGNVNRFTATGGGLTGDFNNDGSVTTADLDVMVLGNAAYDVTGDGAADAADLSEMVTNLIGTWIGDSNGDGEFSSGDFVQVFGVGKFETGEAATWSEGDWNLDGEFTTSDFVAAFTEGGYELGPRAGVSAVPEPTGFVVLLTSLCGLTMFRRRR
ncbi:MAG: hypothetical protein KDA87_06930 [Planctomycetales bacterium]|nr:hypothetical protein [Planctomycetales bacterium]